MYCPKCRFEAMLRVVYRSVEVYRCPTCGGMVLETDERDALLGTEPSYSPLPYDGGRAPRHCFRCSIDMIAVEDSSRRTMDRCPICGAVFIEGGQA
jgi:Zn-finger nucleic acid-binding protein